MSPWPLKLNQGEQATTSEHCNQRIKLQQDRHKLLGEWIKDEG